MGGILRLALEMFVFYILYKLVVDFIIPIYKTTKNMKSKINEMNSKMEEQSHAPQFTAPKESKTKPSREDYIDYEEVK